MNRVPTESAAQQDARVRSHESTRADFVRWAAAQLGWEAHPIEGGWRVEGPSGETPEGTPEAAAPLPIELAESAAGSASQLPDAVDWFARELGRMGPAVHSRPRGGVVTTHEVAARLLPAYQVDQGGLHLAGCSLEDRAFVRLTFAATPDSRDAVMHIWVAPDGSSVDEAQVAELGLDQLEPAARPWPRIDASEIAALESAGRRMAAQRVAARDPSASAGEPLAVALVWLKHAAGKLQLTVGEHSTVVPFAGWAKTLAPPPYKCPYSQIATHHVAALDDGRIVAAEAIALCQHSGKRAVRNELVRCHGTGKHVLPEFVAQCPVLAQPVLQTELVSCPTCQQQVSQAALSGSGCRACRKMARVTRDDPRLVWILDEYPGLAEWKTWQLSETQNAYVATGSGLVRRLLLVVDRLTLQVTHLATGNRFSGAWHSVPAEEQSQFLEA